MNRMKELRQERGITMKDAAQQLNLPYTTYVNYEKGTREPNSETLIQIANFYNTSIDYLLGKSDARIDDRVLDIVNELDFDTLAQAGNIRDALKKQQMNNTPIPPGLEPLPEMATVPLIGDIACGTPITAEQNVVDRIGVPAAWRADYALTCHGDSMVPKIQDGDIVCVRCQPTVENGEIAVVLINGEATLKRFYRQGDTVTLMPENQAACAPMVYQGPEINELCIEGKAVGICRAV